jgi:uncharacterized membrane protein YuzA (DUF378 family)
LSGVSFVTIRTKMCGSLLRRYRQLEMLKRLEPLALLIVFLGALNWGILGVTDGDTNVLSEIFGSGTLLNVVYVIVGVAGLVFVPRLMEALHIGRPHPRGA